MQIVIEISDETYEYISNGSETSIDESNVVTAVRNGTPLPKDHGDLIDRDLLRNKISEDKREAFTKHEVWLLTSKYNTDIPVIVQADKEVKNEELAVTEDIIDQLGGADTFTRVNVVSKEEFKQLIGTDQFITKENEGGF